jgi:hypothetical protein
MANRVEISAQSLSGLLGQGFSPRMSALYAMEFGRVQLASGSVVRKVTIEEPALFTGEVDDDLPCDCHVSGAPKVPDWIVELVQDDRDNEVTL